jgi:isopentenyl-diphosphate Delta-isomerase
MPAPRASALIDWVDAADRPIAKVKRSEVFSRRAGFRVVHIFLFNEDGHLLLQQLGRNRDRNPLKWGSSVAGYLKAGEDYFEGATRRVREELGLTTPLTKFGSAVMLDEGARKFISLYLTSASEATVAEPAHIEALRFESMLEIRSQVERWPGNFTATFLFLFRFYLSTLRLTEALGEQPLGELSVPSWNLSLAQS